MYTSVTNIVLPLLPLIPTRLLLYVRQEDSALGDIIVLKGKGKFIHYTKYDILVWLTIRNYAVQ